MIVIVARFPEHTNEQDGMMQRIAAIDEVLKGYERVYLDLSFRKYVFPKFIATHGVRVLRLNALLHFPIAYAVCARASFVYVHSVYNALKILPVYVFRSKLKIITDMHGVVPEELEYSGKVLVSRIMGIVEALAVRRSWALVVVTKAMAEHFRRKYSGIPVRMYTIPVFDPRAHGMDRVRQGRLDASDPGNQPLRLVYAGGYHPWQKIDLMLDVIESLRDWPCRIRILTGNPMKFKDELQRRNLEGIEVASVPKGQIYEYYWQSDLGFVLRDDTVINRVACPTKLVEYMENGVIPIVLHPAIGDFKEQGYAYIELEDLLKSKFQTRYDLENMREQNYKVIKRIKEQSIREAERLVRDANQAFLQPRS